MYLERKEELSVYYWLKNTVFQDAPFVNVVDEFPMGTLTLPTVSVDGPDIEGTPLELGNRRDKKYTIWFIDVFGKNKTQRDEYVLRIYDYLELGIPVYNYDVGFPPDVTPPQIGVLVPENIAVKKIKVIPELVETLYWRSMITFIATYEAIGG